MKSFLITLFAACAVVAVYFGVRYLAHRDLGFTPARKYVRDLAQNLLHTEITAAREVGQTSEHSGCAERPETSGTTVGRG